MICDIWDQRANSSPFRTLKKKIIIVFVNIKTVHGQSRHIFLKLSALQPNRISLLSEFRLSNIWT